MSVGFLRRPETTLFLEEMSQERIEEIEQRMYPGSWSESGFLLPGQSLVQVIQEDAETLARHSITYEQMALQLGSVIERAKRIASDTFRCLPLLNGKYLVQKEQRYQVDESS